MRTGARLFAASLALLLLIGALGFAEREAAPPDSPKTFEATLHATLRGVIDAGADLYNDGGDPAACYRLYEGSLRTIGPLLHTRPELQKAITRALASAEQNPLTWQRAFILRGALDKVRKEINPGRGDEKLKMPKADEADAKDKDKDKEKDG